MSLTSVDLPEPDTPVTATKHAERDVDVDVRAGCARGRRGPTSHSLARRRGACSGTGMRALAGEVLAGDRLLGACRSPSTGPAVDDLAAVLAGARADVDDPVGLADGVLVVLDDEHRVAEVAQADERVDEAVVVALVQPDRRLVEHVQHADEARADLGGQPDALRLAAGERAGRARQRQVVEADVEQEAEAGVDLLDHPLGDHPVALGQLEAGEELGRLADRQVAHLGDVAARRR